MQKIEVKILDTALFKLVLKDFSRIIVGQNLMTRVLRCNIIALARVFCEELTYYKLGLSAVIGVCGIKIVYSCLDSSVNTLIPGPLAVSVFLIAA